MSFQQNVNQALSLAGLLVGQLPYTKSRAEGKALMGRGLAAEQGLRNIKTDVYDKLVSGEKKAYSDIEISDIESRIPQLNKDIYSTIISKEDPTLGKFIDKEKFMPREERSQILSSLGDLRKVNKLTRVNQAKESAKQSMQAKNIERTASNNFVKSMEDLNGK